MTETYPLWDEEKVHHVRGFALQRSFGNELVVQALKPELFFEMEVKQTVNDLIRYFRNRGDLVREEDMELKVEREAKSYSTIIKARWNPPTQNVEVEIHGYEEEPILMTVSDIYRSSVISLVRLVEPYRTSPVEFEFETTTETLYFHRSGWNPNTQRWTYHPETTNLSPRKVT